MACPFLPICNSPDDASSKACLPAAAPSFHAFHLTVCSSVSHLLQRQVTENITVAESLAIIENGVAAGYTKATILCSKCHAQVCRRTRSVCTLRPFICPLQRIALLVSSMRHKSLIFPLFCILPTLAPIAPQNPQVTPTAKFCGGCGTSLGGAAELQHHGQPVLGSKVAMLGGQAVNIGKAIGQATAAQKVCARQN
jgi:hypothetical protein